MTTQADVIAALEVFRSCFASDLTMLTARQESHCGRAAAQEGLQLVWSFVAADSPIDEAGDSLLRAAFPDEMFGNDAQGAFDKLRGSVDDAYADIWKHSASEQLAALVVACATTGTEEPIYRYRDNALRLAALTCD
ncbi:MAG TPA: hypothetical protein VL068_04695, partial [Microthrixaceae bacterium]|nr:hypothetical protein [Microthrixaceae bacterium]